MDTIPTWGKSFKLSFKLYISSPSKYDQVLAIRGANGSSTLTDVDGNTCWSCTPLVIVRGNHFHVNTKIGNTESWISEKFQINLKTWFEIDLEQYEEDNKVVSILMLALSCLADLTMAMLLCPPRNRGR